MKCQICGAPGAYKRRQGSRYVNDDRNFAVLCDICQAESDDFWCAMNDEYVHLVSGINPRFKSIMFFREK